MARSFVVSGLLTPIVEFLRPMPSVAIIPLAIVFFGIDDSMKRFVATYGALWPILLNTWYGVRSAESQLVEISRMLRLGRLRTLFLVILPAASPFIMTGLRLGSIVTLGLVITAELIAQHGLTPEEFERIRKILGREPNFTELGIFSVMWSEHCSYKNSRRELKKFPTTGPNILVKAGEENAGVVDIGDGWAVAFKIESHNHPSAIEPFQGAATGVGGIIRDIFTMGARPEFLLNSLRFGPITGDSPNVKTNRRLFTGVIAGIAHYGNCIGVPTIGGEIYFDESFEGNPLVNVFCLGVLRHEQLARGAAKGVGNPIFYVGAETGRDGLAGAAFASRELTEESKEDRPAVQVGDPFKEKLLLEACLELLGTDAVAGIQDMGAAGLTCSTCETASRGGTGVEIDLAKVPKRETGMTPYETLLSESQERMLIIARKGKEDVVRRIFEKWDVPCAEIGRVTDDGLMRVLNDGTTVSQIPARPLAEEAPLYSREAKLPSAGDAGITEEEIRHKISAPSASEAVNSLRQLLRNPTIASKNWVYRQYDYMVRTGTVVWPAGIAIAAIWLVQLPTAYLLSHSIGLDGVWMGYPAGFVAALVAQMLYYGLVWRHRSDQ